MPLRLRQEIQEVSRRGKIEQFSNSRAVSGIEQGGFFLRKKPLSINGLPLQQLENCYRRRESASTSKSILLVRKNCGAAIGNRQGTNAKDALGPFASASVPSSCGSGNAIGKGRECTVAHAQRTRLFRSGVRQRSSDHSKFCTVFASLPCNEHFVGHLGSRGLSNELFILH